MIAPEMRDTLVLGSDTVTHEPIVELRIPDFSISVGMASLADIPSHDAETLMHQVWGPVYFRAELASPSNQFQSDLTVSKPLFYKPTPDPSLARLPKAVSERATQQMEQVILGSDIGTSSYPTYNLPVLLARIANQNDLQLVVCNEGVTAENYWEQDIAEFAANQEVPNDGVLTGEEFAAIHGLYAAWNEISQQMLVDAHTT